jgi:hypothetical protein
MPPSKTEAGLALKQIQIYGLLPTLQFQKVKCCANVCMIIKFLNNIISKLLTLNNRI